MKKIIYRKWFSLQSYRHLKNFTMMNIMKNINNLGKEYNQNDITYRLDSFDKSTSIYKFDQRTDLEIGGSSQSRILFNEDHISLEGRIHEDENKVLQQNPYIRYDYVMGLPLKVSKFNGIQMEIKTDCKLYKFMLFVNSQYDLNHQAFGFLGDTSNQWRKMIIPFQNLQIRETKHDDYKQVIFFVFLNLQKLRLSEFSERMTILSLSIMRESKQFEETSIKIKNIDLIYMEELNKLVEVYQQPLAIYKLQAGYFMNGRGQDVININQEDSQVLKPKKSVNDFY